MVVFNPLLLFVALAHFASLTLTQPLDSITAPSLAERANVCYNAPATKAGTFLKRSNPDSADLSPRGSSEFPGKGWINWCAPSCQTYIRVVYISELPAGKTDWSTVRTYMSKAQAICQLQLNNGDTVIPQGGWWYGENWLGNHDFELLFYNSNNHQLTWGVNRAALVALADYFDTLEKKGTPPGTVQFTIVDGKNEVAAAAFGLQGQWTKGNLVGRDFRPVV